MFQPGQKIVVRSTNPRRDGFVARAGTFERFSQNGKVVHFDWCGMADHKYLSDVTVEASSAPFCLY